MVCPTGLMHFYSFVDIPYGQRVFTISQSLRDWSKLLPIYMANSRAVNAQRSLVRRAIGIWIDTSHDVIFSILQQENSILHQVRSSQIHRRLLLSRSYSEATSPASLYAIALFLPLANNILKKAHGKKRAKWVNEEAQILK